MTKHTHHATHPDIVKRLKRANGHLLSVIKMIEMERPCTDIAQQLHAVEKAGVGLRPASQLRDGTPATAEFKAITKYH